MRLIGTEKLIRHGLSVHGDMHPFRRAVSVQVVDDSIIIRQFEYVCVFCGVPTYKSHRGLGICDDCLENLLEKRQKRRRKR